MPTADRIRADLTERLRRFEWGLARDEQARVARALIRGRTHELLNFVQIVDLAGRALAPHTAPAGEELLADLIRAADDAKVSLRALQAAGHAEERPPARTLVAACARAAVAQVAGALAALDAQVLVADAVAVGLAREELELVLIAAALDGDADARVELLVRAREIEGRPCVEIVCGPIAEDGMGARLAAVVAAMVGGDAAVAERRGGGHELAVTVPVVA